jgi:hypothetical protein
MPVAVTLVAPAMLTGENVSVWKLNSPWAWPLLSV